MLMRSVLGTLLITSVCLFSCANHKDGFPSSFDIIINLEPLEPGQVTKDISYLQEFYFVSNVRFVSKENEDIMGKDTAAYWKKVLTEKPLPDRYIVTINGKEFSRKDIPGFKQAIVKNIPGCSEISYPLALIRE
jgi:hypothetical protein